MPRRTPSPPTFATHVHLLGQVDYEACLTAQKRLAYDAVTRGDGRLVMLLCEHPELITIGRRGSREQLRFTGAELAERALTVRYVARGGGCLLHGPGQLAVYVITQLAWHDWSVGEFLRRLQAGLSGALRALGVATHSFPGSFNLWSAAGLVAPLGVAIRYGVTSHGAFLNVNPEPRHLRRIEACAPREYATLTSHASHFPAQPIQAALLSETSPAVKMTSVRAALIPHLTAAFGCQQHQLHTGHPLLPELPGPTRRESAA